MASVLVVETSVANNSSSQHSNHPNNHFQSRCVTTLLIILFGHIHFTPVLSRFPSRSKQFLNFPFKNICIWTFLGPVFSNYFRIVKKNSKSWSFLIHFHDSVASRVEFQTVRSYLRIDRFCEYQQNASATNSTVFWVIIKSSFSSTEYFVDYKVPICWNALLGLN